MILDNYCIIYPNYFTESEVNRIHACANQVEEIEGRTGFGIDEDEDPNGVEMALDVRQSSQKWLQHHVFPREIQDKITLGINTASAEGNSTVSPLPITESGDFKKALIGAGADLAPNSI